VDYYLLRELNHFSAAHDWFEDALGRYVSLAAVLFAAVLVIGLLLGGTARRAALSGTVSLGLALAVAHVVSGLVDRPRPFVAHPHAVHLFAAHAPDASFPSDHATAAFAIAMAVWLRDRRWGTALLVLAALLALGRVALGLHYPADVVAGALLGIVSALLVYAPPIRRRLDRLGADLPRVRLRRPVRRARESG
jgi:undecaprenyl-diphosphatase